MANIIRPWIVRGYQNDTKEQSIYFFDNGYGVSVIEEVMSGDGFNARIFRQSHTADGHEFRYSNTMDHDNSIAIMYDIDDSMSAHIANSYLTSADVQAILRMVKNLPEA